MASRLEKSDEELYRSFQQGSGQAFETLYQRYRQPLYRYLLRHAPSEADDLFQEVWSRIIQATAPFDGGSFKGWIFRIAHNLQIDWYRRKTLRPVSDSEFIDADPDAAPGPAKRAHELDCTQRLMREIGNLPNDQRDAFLLKEEAGLTLAQIADLVRVGRETIKSRLRYALKKLRSALEECL